ncbi:MAG: hypothetical protein ACE5K0_08765 [Candidatus Methanofastidiosia archaeon]
MEHQGKINYFLDSELVVNHLNKVYRVKSSNLLDLFLKVRELERCFDEVIYTHTPRNHKMIRKVDALVNRCLDKNLGRRLDNL